MHWLGTWGDCALGCGCDKVLKNTPAPKELTFLVEFQVSLNPVPTLILIVESLAHICTTRFRLMSFTPLIKVSWYLFAVRWACFINCLWDEKTTTYRDRSNAGQTLGLCNDPMGGWTGKGAHGVPIGPSVVVAFPAILAFHPCPHSRCWGQGSEQKSPSTFPVELMVQEKGQILGQVSHR